MLLTDGFSVTFLEVKGSSAHTHESHVEGAFTCGSY